MATLIHKKEFILLGVIIVLISTVITIFFGNLTKYRVVEVFLKEEVIHAGTLADQAALSLQDELKNLEKDLAIAATKSPIKDLLPGACAESVTQTFELMKDEIGNLARIGPDKTFRCSVNKSLDGLSADSFGGFIDPLFKDPNSGAILSRVVESPGNKEKTLALHIPVFASSGNFNGTIGGAIYLSRLRNYMSKVTLYRNNNRSVLLDDDGTILYHRQKELVGLNVFNEEDKKVIKPEESSLYRTVIQTPDLQEPKFADFPFDVGKGQVAYRSFEIFPGRFWTIFIPVSEVDVEKVIQSVNSQNTGLLALILDLGLIGLVSTLFYIYEKRRHM